MSNYFQDILDFHKKFGLLPDEGPRPLPAELEKFRVGFMEEELQEYKDSIKDNNLEMQLDALVDLVYVAIGTAVLHGFDFDEAWNRVHAANMSKVRAVKASDSKRGTAYDVVKPQGWKPPVLKDLVQPRNTFADSHLQNRLLD